MFIDSMIAFVFRAMKLLGSSESCRPMDNLQYRLIFDLDKSMQAKKNNIAGKNLIKVVKFRNLVAKCGKIRKI